MRFISLKVIIPLRVVLLCRVGVYSQLQVRTMAEEVKVETASAKPTADESVPLVLVTGATGYIATHVIQQLLLSGNYRVRGTIRSLKNEEKVKALKELVPDAKYPLDLCEAELLNKESWPPAVRDCKYVFHLASPFPPGAPKHADDVIRPAVDGTINVLTACAESGSVQKVVLTSSIAAISCGFIGHPKQKQGHVYTEEDWSPPEGCPPYERSKTLAEKAAWDFVKELPEEKKFEMAVVNPAMVIGPALTKSAGTSLGLIVGLLKGDVPGVPEVGSVLVDVRDVAKAEIAVMEKPDSNGNRYALVAESGVPLLQLCNWLKEEFGPQGYKVGTKKVPKLVAWIGSKFSPEMKNLYPSVGKKVIYDNKKMVDRLGIKPHTAKESCIDSGYSVIELGLVDKKEQYHGQNAGN